MSTEDEIREATRVVLASRLRRTGLSAQDATERLDRIVDSEHITTAEKIGVEGVLHSLREAAAMADAVAFSLANVEADRAWQAAQARRRAEA